tara:strand:+ start:593 stop:1132 length:540 start_codon:yes stop_codon:yes gene_type:complete
MAIDNMQGKVTTTGTMDAGPKMPKGKVDPKLPVQKKEQPVTKQVVQNKPMTLKDQFPNASETELTIAERLKTLTDDDISAIQNVLSPSVAGAFGKIVPELAPVFEQYRTEEPNLVMPMSVAANYAMKQYGVRDPKQAVAVLTEDIFGGMQPTMETRQTNVPPGNEPQGLMTSPQTMETV